VKSLFVFYTILGISQVPRSLEEKHRMFWPIVTFDADFFALLIAFKNSSE